VNPDSNKTNQNSKKKEFAYVKLKYFFDETVKFILEYDVLVSCNYTKQAGGRGEMLQ